MGVPLEEVELLEGGIDTTKPTMGSYAMNMIHREGAWEVRKGFGQVAQYDTSMSTNPRVVLGTPADKWGYSKHVGSHLMLTRFGHTQVVTVLECNNVSGNVRQHDASYLGQSNWLVSTYCVNVHDLTTGERWEEPIYRHTSEGDRLVAPLYERLGHYLSSRDNATEEWVAHGGSQVWFVEWDGRLLFGNDMLGVMLYSPCTFNGNTLKSIDMTRETNWTTGHCESAAFTRVSPARGLFYNAGAGHAYVDAGQFPAPTAAAALGDRVVYASRRNLFFSDPFFPTCIMVANVMDVPSDTEITALAAVGDTLLIMTSTQTWYFRPPAGSVVSQGRGATLLSSKIGCVSAGAVTEIDGAVAWCDPGGVYMSSGQGIEKLSEPVDKFFSSFITDPVTNWYPLQGHVGTDAPTGTPPRRSLTLSIKTDGLRMSYSEHLDALFLSVPGENMALCYADSQWSTWVFDSNAKNAPAPDGALQNIQNPQILCRDKRVLLIGSLDEQVFTDVSTNPLTGNPVNDHATSRSYYILEYGRGGGIDRSVDNEDNRVITGKYIVTVASTGAIATGGINNPSDYYGGWVTIDPWIKVARAYTFPAGVGANSRTFLLPISVVPPKQWGVMPTGASASQRSVHQFTLKFAYDSTKWQPIFRAGGPDIDFLLPSERLSSVLGYGPLVPANQHVRAETLLGVADVNGPVISIAWTGVGAAATWYHHPAMNINALRKTLLLYIPMRSITAGNVFDLSGMSLTPLGTFSHRLSHLNVGTGLVEHTAPLSTAFWEQWSSASPREEDNVAQPVDWAYKSAEMASEPDRLSARGVAVKLLSHGVGADAVTTYPLGLFNTLVAADQKMLMAQPVDHAGNYTWTASDPQWRPVSIQTNVYPNPAGATVPHTVHDTLRSRLIAPNNTLNQVTFNHPTAGVAVWGNDGSLLVNAGDVLIADEQVDTIVTSDSLKCSSFSYLMFGFIQNRAEVIKLEMAKGLYRVRGKARRRGGR